MQDCGVRELGPAEGRSERRTCLTKTGSLQSRIGLFDHYLHGAVVN